MPSHARRHITLGDTEHFTRVAYFTNSRLRIHFTAMPRFAYVLRYTAKAQPNFRYRFWATKRALNCVLRKFIARQTESQAFTIVKALPQHIAFAPANQLTGVNTTHRGEYIAFAFANISNLLCSQSKYIDAKPCILSKLCFVPKLNRIFGIALGDKTRAELRFAKIQSKANRK